MAEVVPFRFEGARSTSIETGHHPERSGRNCRLNGKKIERLTVLARIASAYSLELMAGRSY